ncbi:MAG: helix-turn-helix domain-containing protein [Subdoligranulum sp.]
MLWSACRMHRQPLTATERTLLQKLAENRGHIVTYDAVCETVGRLLRYENSLNVHIRHLREKLEPAPASRSTFNGAGIGYKLAEERTMKAFAACPPLCAATAAIVLLVGGLLVGQIFLWVQVQCGGCNGLRVGALLMP